MYFFDNPTKLFGIALGLFLVLTAFVAIMPAMTNQRNNAPLPGSVQLSEEAQKGKALFIANGCVACHTQQVRNVAMDQVWGERPGLPADYAQMERTDFWRNTATLMGTERTGPDLTSVGTRQPSKEWNLVHLFNPRIVVKESVMPAYRWLFDTKPEAAAGETVVSIPDSFKRSKGVVVAKPEALQLVAYLQSLKQAKLPNPSDVPAFLYEKQSAAQTGSATGQSTLPNGQALYATHCQACHQENGEGLKGAFPPLKGSRIVLDPNPKMMLAIILKGYDARPEFGVMPAVGTNANLKPEEIQAIINHERTSWGNNTTKVTAAEVTRLMEAIKGDSTQ
ncbi:cbb3-type cytochrome c oxidase subunit II [Larkinella terrae]|uniref:C-type cytochrome n=1 Tax=Larkinella terrae TaxID=2025311 RepID=A0A7K0EEG7_9BACT|nr:cbb3-type cytochrome c oxidase subunit II [Larkinella terrae]MRS60229.1 c-type cytochrome [Larkinella terrae]